MSVRVRIRPRAREDISDARDWYETQSAGLGGEFGRELDKLVNRVAANKFAYHAIHKNIRRGLTRRFPFAIYFIVEENTVTVLRVLHQARDPREFRR